MAGSHTTTVITIKLKKKGLVVIMSYYNVTDKIMKFTVHALAAPATGEAYLVGMSLPDAVNVGSDKLPQEQWAALVKAIMSTKAMFELNGLKVTPLNINISSDRKFEKIVSYVYVPKSKDKKYVKYISKWNGVPRFKAVFPSKLFKRQAEAWGLSWNSSKSKLVVDYSKKTTTDSSWLNDAKEFGLLPMELEVSNGKVERLKEQELKAKEPKDVATKVDNGVLSTSLAPVLDAAIKGSNKA